MIRCFHGNWLYIVTQAAGDVTQVLHVLFGGFGKRPEHVEFFRHPTKICLALL
jgi:hypothetical protein